MLQEVIFALFFMTRPTTFNQQAFEFIGVLTDSGTFKALPLRRMIDSEIKVTDSKYYTPIKTLGCTEKRNNENFNSGV